MGINNKYVEVAAGGVSNRGNICKVKELSKYLKPNLELYRSMYRLDDSAIEQYDLMMVLLSLIGLLLI